MSDTEALMWNLEKDPALRSAFLNITFLDRPPDLERLRRRMEAAIPKVPRLAQRVVPAAGGWGAPEFRPDPQFSLDHHVRRMAVPAPGDDRQLLDLAANLYEDPFDRARPLWQFTVVEGLSGGRAALLSKMHHTITDGVGGLRLSMQFIDASPDGPDQEDAPAGAVGDRSAGDTSLLGNVARTATLQVARAGKTIGAIAGLAVRPGTAVDTARSLLRQGAVVEPARSRLWAGRRSLTRRFEAMRLDLDGLRAAGKNLGGTVNDAYVTVITGAVGGYHRAKGAEVGDLRMTMPVNTRTDRGESGNSFAPTRVLVPAGVVDPAERFDLVRQRLATTKSERAIGLAGVLAGVLINLPTAIQIRLAHQQVGTVDFATSNLRGAPFDLWIAGAHIESNHPMGPTAGTPLNATVLSYKGSLDLGLNLDGAAIDDPDLLVECVAAAEAELLALG
jgi:WS/DGAT/MGAT family acyltransferase